VTAIELELEATIKAELQNYQLIKNNVADKLQKRWYTSFSSENKILP